MFTNFMHSILLNSFGSDVCDMGERQCAACDNNEFLYEPDDSTFCCWKSGYASTGCTGWFDSVPYPDHVFMLRSIYPWLLSMYDMPMQYDGLKNEDGYSPNCTFADFIRNEFVYSPDGYPDYKDSHPNPIQMWNAKLNSYYDFMANATLRNESFANITTEILFDEDKLNRAMQPLLDDGYELIFGQKKFSWPNMSTYDETTEPTHGEKPGPSTGSDWSYKEFMLAKVYDGQQLWKGLLTQEDVDFINSEVDTSLMDRAGFEVLYNFTVPTLYASRGKVHTASALTYDEHMRHLRYLDDPIGAGRHQKLSPAARRRRKHMLNLAQVA